MCKGAFWKKNYVLKAFFWEIYLRIACKSVILCLLTPFIRNDSLILLLFYQQSSFPSSKSHMLTYFLPWIQRTTVATRYILILHLYFCQFSFHHTDESIYSKASRYTASSCTVLNNAGFRIGSKKIWDAQIYVLKTLCCTVFWWSYLCLIK